MHDSNTIIGVSRLRRTKPLLAKAGRFDELLKQPKGCMLHVISFPLLLSCLKVIQITSLLQNLILDIFFDDFICHISTACNKATSCPQMLSPVLLVQFFIFHLQFPGCISFYILYQLACKFTLKRNTALFAFCIANA